MPRRWLGSEREAGSPSHHVKAPVDTLPELFCGLGPKRQAVWSGSRPSQPMAASQDRHVAAQWACRHGRRGPSGPGRAEPQTCSLVLELWQLLGSGRLSHCHPYILLIFVLSYVTFSFVLQTDRDFCFQSI